MSGATERLNTALSGRYRIERQLGQGGMATVYLAQDLKHDRKVAVKVLKPELAAVLGAERFVVEIKTTAALQHPHILPLFDSGTADGFLYYVMPYIEGETLRDRLNRENQLGVEDAIRITTEVADALDYAHRHGVIHRDIKPENILLHDGRPMVADFGIALAVSAAAGGRMTETGLSLGTPHYMSPEQATAEKDITARSDIYSLASVMYEMLAGAPPHSGGSAQQIIMRIITDTARPVTDLRKSVPPHVAAALTRALEKLPADRFDTAKAFAAALKDPHFSVATASAAHAAPAGRVRPWMIGAGVAAGLLLGVAGGMLIPGGGTATRDLTFRQHIFVRASVLNARWGADGKTILYTDVDLTSGAPSINIIRPEYPEPQRFGPKDARVLAVSSQNEVALLVRSRGVGQRIGTGTLARMSIGGGTPREIAENVQEADWSPDGAQLAITRNTGDHDQIEYPLGKMFYSSQPRSYVSDLRVAPDGKRIAFFLHPIRYDDRGWVMVVDGDGAVTRLDEEFGGLEGLAWNGGAEVLFSAAQNGEYEIRRWRPGTQSYSQALPNAGRLTIYDSRSGRWLVSRDDVTWVLLTKAPGADHVRDVSFLNGGINPRISADGSMMAFTDQGTLSSASYGVMIRGTDGSPAVRIGEGNVQALSGDKKWVLGALPTSPPEYRLYPTGAGTFKVLSWPKLKSVLAAGFSTDSKHIWLCGAEPDKAQRCYSSALEGGDVTPITGDRIIGIPRPDGQAIVWNKDGQWYVQPAMGGPRRDIPGLAQRPIRWSPDGKSVWVLAGGPAKQRKVESIDVMTGKRSLLFMVDELEGVATPFVAAMTIADDGKSYAYFTSTYYSLLFTVDGVR